MWDPVNWRHWRAVIKLDPDKVLPPGGLTAITKCNPDAIIVGGTQGITAENTRLLVNTVRQSGYDGIIVQEISEPAAVVDNVDAHFIPVVLNAGNCRWITGLHHEAIKKYKDLINWSKVLTEGYVICNPVSAAGKLTGALPVDAQAVVAYGVLAGQLLGIPLLYIEYSGMFGEISLVEAVAGECGDLHLVYGGGIKNSSQAKRMLRLVDTIVIGNLVYENPAGLYEIFKEI